MGDSMYVVTVTEVVPGMGGDDINTISRTVVDLDEAAKVVENFWLNFGVLVSIIIVPLP